MSEERTCCEPTGEMVGALREVLELAGYEVGAGAARAALTAALMVEHERRDHGEAAQNPADPRGVA